MQPTLRAKQTSYPISFANSGAVDAFARLRVSNPHTIFDSKQIFDGQSLFWDDAETSGSGTSSTYSANKSSTAIAVGNVTAGTRVRQTLRRFNYQPGKSQLVFMTLRLDPIGGGSGITRRVGLFDENNGIFLEDDAGTINFVRRTYTGGSATDNETVLPTTFADGTTIDWTKTQIIWFDLEWLGVGRVRMGVVKDGTPEVLHEEDGVNTLTAVYMTTPNLPLRYEISNTGAGVASSLECICSTVISEGGLQETGVVRYASTAGTAVTTGAVTDTLYPIIGIRLGSSYLDATVQVLGVNLFVETAASEIEWILFWGGGANPLTIGGTFTYSAQTESSIEFATGGSATSISGGVQIAGGHVVSGSPSSGGKGLDSTEVANSLLLGSKIDGTQDEIVLAARGIAGSTSVDLEAGITWRELL